MTRISMSYHKEMKNSSHYFLSLPASTTRMLIADSKGKPLYHMHRWLGVRWTSDTKQNLESHAATSNNLSLLHKQIFQSQKQTQKVYFGFKIIKIFFFHIRRTLAQSPRANLFCYKDYLCIPHSLTQGKLGNGSRWNASKSTFTEILLGTVIYASGWNIQPLDVTVTPHVISKYRHETTTFIEYLSTANSFRKKIKLKSQFKVQPEYKCK